MANNTKSQVFRFKIRTSGMYLDRAEGFDGELKLQISPDGGSSWKDFPEGATTPVGLPDIHNLDPALSVESFVSSNFPIVPFVGVPDRGEDLELALLVEDTSIYPNNIKYRVLATPCKPCWELYFSNPATRSRAVGTEDAVVAIGNVIE